MVLLCAISIFSTVSAQKPGITPIDPNYINGVEKFIGSVIPESGEVRLFPDVGFTVPTGYKFTPNSYSLTVGQYYNISNVSILDSDTLLFVTVNFGPIINAPVGDLLDTLVIQVNDIPERFVLPIRGSVIPFDVSPNGILFDPAFPGDTVRGSVAITTVSQRPEQFTFKLGGQSFSIADTVINKGIPITTINLGVQFIAPNTPGAVYEDSLFITHRSYPGVVYKVPIKASVSALDVNPRELAFGRVIIGDSDSLDLIVKSKVKIDTFYIEDNTEFIVTPKNWDPNTGGVLTVTYTPTASEAYDYAYLDLVYGANTVSVLLTGIGSPKPVITVDSTSYNFGYVPVDSIKFSDEFTIVLSDPFGSLLTDPGAITIDDDEDVFFIETIEPGETTNPDTVYVTVSFSPLDEDVSYLATLNIIADNADPVTITLRGNSIAPIRPLLSPQQATALSTVEATPASLSVKNGDLIVARAPLGSTVRVYDLNGRSLKRQTVASEAEVLKTADFPQNVYIILVNDRKQVILKQKVLLP